MLHSNKANSWSILLTRILSWMTMEHRRPPMLYVPSQSSLQTKYILPYYRYYRGEYLSRKTYTYQPPPRLRPPPPPPLLPCPLFPPSSPLLPPRPLPPSPPLLPRPPLPPSPPLLPRPLPPPPPSPPLPHQYSRRSLPPQLSYQPPKQFVPLPQRSFPPFQVPIFSPCSFPFLPPPLFLPPLLPPSLQHIRHKWRRSKYSPDYKDKTLSKDERISHPSRIKSPISPASSSTSHRHTPLRPVVTVTKLHTDTKGQCYPKISVMSYNVLSQDLIDKNMYLYTRDNPEWLDWTYRKHKILYEMTTCKPDVSVVCFRSHVIMMSL